MTAFDAKFVPLALKLINKFGRSATIVDDSAQTFNAATGKMVGTVAEEVITISPPIDVDKRFVDNDVVKASDVTIFIAASGLNTTPEQGMKVKFSSRTMRIVKVMELWSGNSITAYRLVLNR